MIRGAGDAFAAGTDIRQFVDFVDGADGTAYERRVAQVLDRLLGMRVPLLGVVEGPAVGAGLALAAVCDIVVATPGALRRADRPDPGQLHPGRGRRSAATAARRRADHGHAADRAAAGCGSGGPAGLCRRLAAEELDDGVADSSGHLPGAR